MPSPEFIILSRTANIIKSMAAAGDFVASANEKVRRVTPVAVKLWQTVEGTADTRSPSGFVNIVLPAICVVPVPMEISPNNGLNCADDEVLQIAVQVLDSSPHGSSTLLSTYLDWLMKIRYKLLAVPNPFHQDASPEVYDPYVVHILRRAPVEAQSLLKHKDRKSVV